MSQEFDPTATARFFNTSNWTYTDELHPRDQILLGTILPGSLPDKPPSEIRVLDFGCGVGRLLATLLDMGFDAVGVEKHHRYWQEARDRLGDRGHAAQRVTQGGVESFDDFEDESIDCVIMMGVMQYLSDADYAAVYDEIHRILKPLGYWICTFQNAFFDLFTFNKYTLDFFEKRIVDPLSPDDDLRERIIEDLKSLIQFPEEPEYSPDRARDNIAVRTTNPLTIQDELVDRGFSLIERYFYEFFVLPPLIEGKYLSELRVDKNQFQRDHTTSWKGVLMANAFIAHCQKD